jgi:hypothetical protein
LPAAARRFETDEEMLDYYEMKAIDAFDNVEADEDNSLIDIPLR